MSYFDKMMKGLEKEIKIPDRVWETYQQTLENLPERKQMTVVHASAKYRFSGAAAILAAVLLFRTVAVAVGVYYQWNHGLEQTMHVEEEQKAVLQENGTTQMLLENKALADETEASGQGITVTAVQSIVDPYNAVLAFTVQGLGLEEGQEPAAGGLDIWIAGEPAEYSGGFYDGTRMDNEGFAVNEVGIRLSDISADMSEEERMAAIRAVPDETGAYTYLIYLDGTAGNGSLPGKEICVTFHDFGYETGKTENITTVEGEWTLHWTLTGTAETRQFQTEVPLGDTGAVVKEIEVSPITLRVVYDWPRQIVEEEGISANGETTSKQYYRDPPALMGVQMKDGTLYPALTEGGHLGYLDEEISYQTCLGLNRVLDLDKVKAVLFLKTPWNMGEGFTEENFYIVPIAG